jgi:hypothetical protein
VGVHDKKGLVLEKSVGDHVKQDNVLDKRPGSARLVQDSGSSEVPSDDREASVECDPRSKVADYGIFGCGMDSHCVESEESELGGFCVALKRAPSINRALQANLTCVEKISEEDAATCNCTYTCDCSQFNNTSGSGSIKCTGTSQYCFGESAQKICGSYDFSYNFTTNADGSYDLDYCDYDFSGVLGTAVGLESFCYVYRNVSSDYKSVECEIKVNDVACDICEFNQVTCPANSSFPLGNDFDCTNTVLNIEGNECTSGGAKESFVDAGMPTTTRTETGPPSAPPPVETSSGSSPAAKVTNVVAAAAAAWMASFGI